MRPVWRANLYNSFSLPWGLTLDADFSYRSEGHRYETFYARPTLLDVSLRKSFLNDALSVTLRGYDLLDKQVSAFRCVGQDVRYGQAEHNDYRQFMLSFRYTFNVGKSRYKGTGAGQDAIDRL